MVEYMTLASGLVSGGIAGGVYGALWYNRNRLKKDGAESFDQRKFSATLIVGALVGLALAYGGVEPTTANIAEVFPVYVGTITMVEAVLKSAHDAGGQRVEKKLPGER